MLPWIFKKALERDAKFNDAGRDEDFAPVFNVGGEGGWLASHVGARIGVPFVALDATYLSPTEDLPMAKDGCGCILVSEGYKHQGGQAVLEGLADAYGPKVISDALLLNPKQ